MARTNKMISPTVRFIFTNITNKNNIVLMKWEYFLSTTRSNIVSKALMI